MKWLLVLVVLVAGTVGINAWASGPDLSGPGATMSGIPDGGPLSPTPEDALGDLLDDAARVTDEANGDDTGYEIVTFRGYDADGELMSTVVVESSDDRWRVAHVDTCE